MQPEAQQRIAQETLDIYAPLAQPARHPLDQERARGPLVPLPGARRCTTELETQRRRRSARARAVHRGGHAQPAQHEAGASGASPPTVTGRPKHLYSIYRKMQTQELRLRADLRRHRVPRHRRRRSSDCYAALGVVHSQLDAGARAASRTTSRMPEAEHVPVAAHDGDRPARRAHRGADPHPRDAPRRRARHRRALEVQGGRACDGRRATRSASPGCGSCWSGSRSSKDPHEFLETVKVDLFQRRGLRLHAEGRRAQLPARRDADRLRLPRPHARSATHCAGAQGQRQASCRSLQARRRRHRRDPHHRRSQTPSKDWLELRHDRTRAQARSALDLRTEQRDRSRSSAASCSSASSARGRLEPRASCSKSGELEAVRRQGLGHQGRGSGRRRSATAS